MNQLYLHIGLTKTGSSAIQSWLSAHAQDLAAIGVRYADLVPEAKRNRISPGNGAPLAQFLGVRRQGREVSEERLRRELRQTYFGGESTAIISAEALSNGRVRHIPRLKELLASLAIEVVVVAYIRSIYDHCWSGYLQMIKRAGYRGEFAEFAGTYPNVQVEALRRWSTAFDLRVVNYDTAKQDLIESFLVACELDLPAGVDTNVGRINRSLSASEHALLLEVNRLAEERGLEFRALLSDALIYANPDAESAFVNDREVLELLREKYAPDVEWVNHRFLAEDPISVESAQPNAASATRTEVAPEVRALVATLLDQIAEPTRSVKRPSSSSSEADRG